MTTLTNTTAWLDDTRAAVAGWFDCGVCLDFGYLDGLGPCRRCDPDGYAEHTYYLTRQPRCGFTGADPWADITWTECPDQTGGDGDGQS